MLSLFLVTPLKLVLLALVALLGGVIWRYSATAFAGEADKHRFLSSLLLTLSAVLLVLVSNHLLLFWLAWVAVSLSLGRLILFYPHRPRAQLAAHKKMLLARFSELLLGGAFLLLFFHYQTAQIDQLMFQVSQQPHTLTVSIAAFMLVGVAIIKCAQLPLHGWLIQVVEAPTPVSALLHAGIVNLGGILLMLFAPVLAASPSASLALLVIAGVSTLVAGLVSLTRVSIKVKLAWSTVAQMGLMLVEIALGLYELALLHLLAHSFYKAFSFLNSGNGVNHWLATQLADASVPRRSHWLAAMATAAGLIVAVHLSVGILNSLAAGWLLWMAMTMLLLPAFTRPGAARPTRVLFSSVFALGLLGLYAAIKHSLIVFVAGGNATYLFADAFALVLFIALFALSLAVQYWPHKAWVNRLFIWLNAGAYLDEWATRLTLKWWPSASLIQLQTTQWQPHKETR
ncbi:NADH dehydrogenase [Salinivibrio sp. PR5]|uniref:NADH-quinone oxidoreductase subunit L n=1 Tax=Salinivibrio sp. PR5 TaxID=1909484 RepID=UPI00098A45E9|nr:NADH-quinone oxidoreductase subunit L [Salinivibrio sp. PR5]OOF09628.1 NADH dehydrogenase [Salinivibrio sp. PR5]